MSTPPHPPLLYLLFPSTRFMSPPTMPCEHARLVSWFPTHPPQKLSELVRVEGYLEWVELAADFTVRSLKEWQWSTNSIHYLLALWGRLVAAVPYVRADAGAKSHTETLQVSEKERTEGRRGCRCIIMRITCIREHVRGACVHVCAVYSPGRVVRSGGSSGKSVVMKTHAVWSLDH